MWKRFGFTALWRLIGMHLFSMHVSFPAARCLCSHGVISKEDELETHTHTQLKLLFRLFKSSKHMKTVLRLPLRITAGRQILAVCVHECVWVHFVFWSQFQATLLKYFWKQLPNKLHCISTHYSVCSRLLSKNNPPQIQLKREFFLCLSGSTFKPLNPVKRLDKSRKRSRRTTIMGIPNQVQKELGMSIILADCVVIIYHWWYTYYWQYSALFPALHRSSTFQQLVSTQLPNHNGQVTDSQSGVVIIPTVDGETPVANKEGARVHLSELEVRCSRRN